MSLRAAPRRDPDHITNPGERSALAGLRRSLAGMRPRARAWAGRWDLLLVLAAAALPRLIWLDQASFLGDQANLLALARSALAHGALPATSLHASIGPLHPPASIYFLLPFAALGDPFWPTLATALANTAAVALLYVVTDRGLGRAAAMCAALLYATAAWPVYYSRFVWQPALLAPAAILCFGATCRGVIERRPGRIVWGVVWWAVAALIHPSAAPLLAVPAVGALFMWRSIRPRHVILAALALAVLLMPTLLWEIASRGSDLALYSAYAAQPSRLDLSVLGVLLAGLTPPDPRYFGAATLYAHVYPLVAWLAPILVALYLFGLGWLALSVAAALWRAPAVLALRARLSRPHERAMGSNFTQVRTSGAASIGSDPRFLALLLVWQLVPPLTMLRHAAPIQEHYLLPILPALPLTIGAFLAGPLARLLATLRRFPAWFARHGPVILSGFLAVGQLASVAAFLSSAQLGQSDGPDAFSYTHYGLPLNRQRADLLALRDIARAQHARAYAATTLWLQVPMGYLAASEGISARVYEAGACLVVPSAGTAPAVVLTTDGLESSAGVAALVGARLLRTLPEPAGAPSRIYSIPAGAALPGDITLRPGPRGPAGPRLSAYQLARVSSGAPSRLVLRWSGAPTPARARLDALDYWYGATPDAAPLADYTVTVQPLDAAGRPLAAALHITCPTLSWNPGEDVYTRLELPATLAARPVASWRASLSRRVYTVARPRVGPLTLETSALALGPSEPLAADTISASSAAQP